MTTLTTDLLVWYDEHHRHLPWRAENGERLNPYHTWVSETMLQQTRVETVLRYFPRFLDRFPTVSDLAAAPEDDVLKMWEGLGYYSRARNLHAGAKQVMADFGGVIPNTAAQLRTIRGVGPYTAGAIASIAFGEAVPAVDGNVIRVVSRVAGIRENVGIPSVRRQIESTAASIVSIDRPGDHNQAMMDLGATLCTPGTPDCARCPISAHCSAFAEGDAEDLPVLPRKKPPKELHYAVCLVFSGSRVLMRQRTESMLHGLWVFPMFDGEPTAKQLGASLRRLGLPVTSVEPAGEGKHVFTHQVWLMRLYRMDAPDNCPAPDGYRFIPLNELTGLAIPAAMKSAVNALNKLI